MPEALNNIPGCEKLYSNALQSKLGIAAQFENTRLPYLWRRRLYNWRDSQRRSGNHEFDCISVIITGTELYLVKRNRLAKQGNPPLPEVKERDLLPEEIPDIIRARGKHKSSLLFQAMLQNLNRAA